VVGGCLDFLVVSSLGLRAALDQPFGAEVTDQRTHWDTIVFYTSKTPPKHTTNTVNSPEEVVRGGLGGQHTDHNAHTAPYQVITQRG
jgi:hypothetical protein